MLPVNSFMLLIDDISPFLASIIHHPPPPLGKLKSLSTAGEFVPIGSFIYAFAFVFVSARKKPERGKGEGKGKEKGEGKLKDGEEKGNKAFLE